MTAAAQPQCGLVVAGFGRQVVVETAAGTHYTCRMKGRNIRPVCGDSVTWTPLEDDQVDGIVTAIATRHNTLLRPNRQGKEEQVAANLSRLIVVFATRPPADPFLVDRYIAAAEHLRIDCVLAYNKSDLGDAGLPDWLQYLEGLGYPVLRTSARTGEGLDALKTICAEGISILVGQSGVGKSSILNTMIPDIHQETGEISESGRFGRHTTSASYLYHLDHANHSGGALIDSPGVRDFAPPPLRQEQVPNGYIEILAAAQECRFNNCRHENEPACAVKNAVEAGTISARRYDSYLKLMALMRTLESDH